METCHQRIDMELRRLGLSNPKAGELLGVSKETVRNLRRGSVEPTATTLLGLARLAGRGVEWFVTGRESAPGLSPDESYLVQLYRDLGLGRAEAARRLSTPPEARAPGPPAPQPLPRFMGGGADLSEISSRRVAEHLEQQERDRGRRKRGHQAEGAPEAD